MLVIEDIDIEAKSIKGFINLIKVLTDHYTFPAHYKGGTKTYSPNIVIFTSNHSLDEFLAGVDQADAAPCFRRIVQFELNKKLTGPQLDKYEIDTDRIEEITRFCQTLYEANQENKEVNF